jgi:alpha/beta superfamily hydrolase
VIGEADHFFMRKLDHLDAAIRNWVTARHPEIAAPAWAAE